MAGENETPVILPRKKPATYWNSTEQSMTPLTQRLNYRIFVVTGKSQRTQARGQAGQSGKAVCHSSVPKLTAFPRCKDQPCQGNTRDLPGQSPFPPLATRLGGRQLSCCSSHL